MKVGRSCVGAASLVALVGLTFSLLLTRNDSSSPLRPKLSAKEGNGDTARFRQLDSAPQRRAAGTAALWKSERGVELASAGRRVHLVTFSHQLPPPREADARGACRFLYSARIAGNVSRVFVAGLGSRQRDKMQAGRFRRAMLDVLGVLSGSAAGYAPSPPSVFPRRSVGGSHIASNSPKTSSSAAEDNSRDEETSLRSFLSRGAPPCPAVEGSEEDLVVYSDLFDVVVTANMERHAQEFTRFAEQRRWKARMSKPSRQTRQEVLHGGKQGVRRDLGGGAAVGAFRRTSSTAFDDVVVFQGDRTSFCPSFSDKYVAHHARPGEGVQAAAARLGLSASKVGGREAAGGGKAAFHHHAFKDAMSPAAAHRGTERNVVESNASRKPSLAFSFNSLQEEEEELLTYPFPNTGWFAGTVAAMRGTLPLLLPDTVGGIDQGHVCAEAARQRLLAMGLVTVDMHADLSLNMNAAPGRRPAVMAEHLARRLGAVINASSVPNSATSSLRQLFEAAPRRRREEALRHQQRALLAVHFSGPSKDTAFPAARSVLQSYLQYRRAVEEDRRSGSGDGGWDWRDGMELFAVDGSGRCSVVPVSLTCPPGDSF